MVMIWEPGVLQYSEIFSQLQNSYLSVEDFSTLSHFHDHDINPPTRSTSVP